MTNQPSPAPTPPRSAPAIDAERTTAEVLHRLLVERVVDYAIFALDATGHVRTWNPGAQRFKGYTADEIIGRHFSTFYPLEDVAARKPERELEIAIATGRVEDEGWRLRKDGSRFWANVVITALRDSEGNLVGFAKVTRDLTERREREQQARELAATEAARATAEARAQELLELSQQLEEQAMELEAQTEEAQALAEELEEANAALEGALADAENARAEAEAANRAKSQFLATMSHELRTPLNAIGGYAELLAMGIYGATTGEQRDAIDRIQQSKRHLQTLIGDVLSFARIEAGHLTFHVADVPLRELLAEIEAVIAPQLEAKQIVLRAAGFDDALAVRADAEKLRQILLNLLGNAIKFTPPHGRVAVTAVRCGEMVDLSVRDSGPGIPSDKLLVIFDPFVQLGRTLTTPHEGVGLGLAISRDLARGMGGDLRAEGAEGTGATFVLTLPAADAGA